MYLNVPKHPQTISLTFWKQMFSWNAVQLFSYLKGSLWIHVLCAEARWISFRVTSPERRLVVKLPSVTATKWLVLLIFSSVGSDCTPQTKNQPFCKPFMRLRFHNLRNPDVYGDAVADVFDKTQAQMQREPPVRQGLLRLFKEIITFLQSKPSKWSWWNSLQDFVNWPARMCRCVQA